MPQEPGPSHEDIEWLLLLHGMLLSCLRLYLEHRDRPSCQACLMLCLRSEIIMPAQAFCGKLKKAMHGLSLFQVKRGGQRPAMCREALQLPLTAAKTACMAREIGPGMYTGSFTRRLEKRWRRGQTGAPNCVQHFWAK